MMHAIEVQAAEGATLIYTVTERATEPWIVNNTTILVTAEQLAPLVQKLQARLAEVQALRQATPQFAVGQVVAVSGTYRDGQRGRVDRGAGKGGAPPARLWRALGLHRGVRGRADLDVSG